jgi:hypothetical protein
MLSSEKRGVSKVESIDRHLFEAKTDFDKKILGRNSLKGNLPTDATSGPLNFSLENDFKKINGSYDILFDQFCS